MQNIDCKSLIIYPRHSTNEETSELSEGVAEQNQDYRRESIMTKLGSNIMKNPQIPVTGGDDFLKEKIRLISFYKKYEDIPLSNYMIKIITRNNLYQELLNERNSRFWYSLKYLN